MRQRALGTTGLLVSEVGFGCARLGGIFHTGSRRDIVRMIQSAVDAGITFFDTSDLYSQGESESILGEALAARRDEVVIASKVGYVLPARRRFASGLKPILRPVIRALGLRRGELARRAAGELGQDFSSAHITAAVDASLTRLRTDRLDLYQLHSPPTAVLEDGEFLHPLERLKSAGKIRFYGVSCETTDDAEVCLRYPELSSIQIRVSVLAQGALRSVVPAAARRGLAVIVRECFAGGLLADKSPTTPPRSGQHEDRIAACAATAERSGRTLSGAALQFALAPPGVSVALVGMRTEEHLRANLRALQDPPLSEAEFADLRSTA